MTFKSGLRVKEGVAGARNRARPGAQRKKEEALIGRIDAMEWDLDVLRLEIVRSCYLVHVVKCILAHTEKCM